MQFRLMMKGELERFSRRELICLAYMSCKCHAYMPRSYVYLTLLTGANSHNLFQKVARSNTCKISCLHVLLTCLACVAYRRELANVIEHASILCDGLPISAADFPKHFASNPVNSRSLAVGGKSLREMEMQTIHATLEQCNGNKTAAAHQLGISLKTLYNKLNSEVIKKAA